MRSQGRVTDWNDDRGFGFITPLDGGVAVFAHVSQFPHAQRRPIALDLVTYDLETDDRGRLRAKNIQFLAPTRKRAVKQSDTAHRGVAMPAALGVALFFAALAIAGLFAPIAWALLAIDLVLSAATAVAYASDKRAAQLGKWRTEESALHVMALFGGWPGALVAQQAFRHKTRKQPFQAIFWFTVICNLLIAGYVVSSNMAVAPG